MRILYFTSFKMFQLPNGEISSSGASTRYRILLPAKILTRLGHQIQIVQLTEEHLSKPKQVSAAVQADLVVIGKVFDNRVVQLVKAIKERKIKVLVDFCDNHFENAQFRSFYMELAHEADEIAVNTAMMAEEIKRLTSRVATAVPDPVEGQKKEARLSPSLPAVKFVWYGYPMGLTHLFKQLENWLDGKLPFPITVNIVTQTSPNLAQKVDAFNQQWRGRCFIAVTEWTPYAVGIAIEQADIVLVPSELNPITRTKSPNRLTEAIYGGRLAIASKLPSYLEFEKFCCLENDGSSFPDILSDLPAFRQRIVTGQDYIEKHYLPFHAALGWDRLISGSASSKPLKLNLGCGDKILPDYINVDIVPSRAGHSPDVLCDLHQLKPFPDDCADEILSVHVLEHFWRWEVRDILKEWRRVLRTGGKIVIECPNLETACKMLLENPSMRTSEGKDGQRSMWVFYGDPAWKDPYMVHRWGYTPDSLKELLTECGFVNVRVEPAQFKLKEPRDMRVVGEKAA